ncbi:MAG: hypothetical protein NVSMB6_28670 [Burkholderiaceae bacterium]
MRIDAERVWQLPMTVKGRDTRLGGARLPLSGSAKARLHRIARHAPEVMVKITGRTRGTTGHLQAHLDYITRRGTLDAITQDGQRIHGRESLGAFNDTWLQTNAQDSRLRNCPNASQSVSIILSMRPGTPPEKVEDAAHIWAKDTFPGTHDWIMVRHDDTDHPHVHLTVRAVGYDGRRVRVGPDELQEWRERFAKELRHRGIEAEATPRQARGIVRRAPRLLIQKAEQRGVHLDVRKTERAEAERQARLPTEPPPGQWSRTLQQRQQAIRQAYLFHADVLSKGNDYDRELSRDVQRFVAEMPAQLMRREVMAIRLRYALAQQSDRRAPPTPSSAPSPARTTPSIPTRPEPGRYDELLRSLEMPRGPPKIGGRG